VNRAQKVSTTAAHAFANLHFRYPFRRYQRMVLDVLDGQAGTDHKYHIVAPPGSGKTIVGLELIRRFGQPAVVFCPTTTIQKQWQEKVGLFTDDDVWLDQHTSLDPRRLAEINVLTYQVLSTPGENLEFVERIAVERWVDDLLESNKAHTETEARQRILTLKEANPKAHRREISKRYRRLKREFLRDGTLAGRQFLHPNARDLIDRIAALGTGTVVLDECHHLLDYWAFILRELLKALPGVRVVGLTATLPDPENQAEYENYTSLLGKVDFEVPTPAVVKEGNLAPYRDLVCFCEPSPREQDYLHQIQRHFEETVWKATNTTPFQDWLWQTLFPAIAQAPAGPYPEESWAFSHEALLDSFEDALRREPLLCTAGIKYLLELGVHLPLDVPLVEEMMEPLGIDDWLILMENYALRALKISAERQHQALYRDLRDALLPFGITISERGIRHHRSPGDLVLALSEAKDRATVDILRAESQALEEKLRAVVITDYERMSARTRRLKGVLDPDAGSAVRVFRRLVADPVTELLAPILVTGKVVLIGARSRPLLEGGIRRWVEEHHARFSWEWRTTQSEEVLRLVGSGPEWSSRNYVALVTDLFERGLSRCLVGTRGIFGEGWDTLRLNTLVDLTSVTTRTGVQQIRGRSIRLDPAWPRKIAHNWDVVCVSTEFDKGNADLRRFATRHEHTWGLVIHSQPETPSGTLKQIAIQVRAPRTVAARTLEGEEVATPATLEGRVVRGLAHIDLRLAVDLATREFRRLGYDAYTRQMLDAVWDRDRVYDLWDIGQPYENQIYSATRLEARDLKFRTAYTVQGSLRTLIGRTFTSALAVGGAVLINGALVIPWLQAQALPQLGLVSTVLTGAAAAAVVAGNGRHAWQVLRQTFVELPADAILLDMGRALLAALRDARLVSTHLDDGCVRVVQVPDGGYEIFVDPACPEAATTPKDAAIFAQGFRQMIGPLGDARYLIERDLSSLRNPLHRASWLLVRKALRLEEDLKAYHRVPDVLASHRQRAEALARHWQQYVGGGRLVYTRTDEGRHILLQARAQQRKQIRQMAFEIWK
jgi:superfamily II DNA or RNA helicase